MLVYTVMLVEEVLPFASVMVAVMIFSPKDRFTPFTAKSCPFIIAILPLTVTPTSLPMDGNLPMMTVSGLFITEPLTG